MPPLSIHSAPALTALKGIAAGCSTRHGGVSAPPFDTLNVGDHVGDAPEAVAENRRRFCEALGFSLDALVTADQVHGTAVHSVHTPQRVAACDGLVTATPGLLLAIAVADCAPVLLADPDAGVVGACHAGWRGAVDGIVSNTLDAMATLGAAPKRIRAHIGPCISTDTFEVGPDVAARFASAFVHPAAVGDRAYIDLKGALRKQLLDAGLAAGRVSLSPHGTQRESETFFSYRASGGTTGRLFGAIGLQPS